MIPWTQKRGAAVARPKTGETPIRHVRVPDETWAQVEEIAEEDGLTRTDVVIEALSRHIAWRQRQRRTTAQERTRRA
jgi:hypothetical protein